MNKNIIKPELIKVDIDLLKPAKFNPPNRGLDIKPLTDSMKDNGFLYFCPIICNEEYVIADGHRRYYAAKALEIKEVFCIIVRGDIDKLWGLMNTAARKLNSREAVVAISLGLKNIPSSFQKRVNLLIDIAGIEAINYLAEKKLSLEPINTARHLTFYCRKEDDYKNFMRKAFYWICETGANFASKTAMHYNYPYEKLAEKIENNIPLDLWNFD